MLGQNIPAEEVKLNSNTSHFKLLDSYFKLNSRLFVTDKLELTRGYLLQIN